MPITLALKGAEARGLEVLSHLWIQSEPKAGLGYKILTYKGTRQSSNSNSKTLHWWYILYAEGTWLTVWEKADCGNQCPWWFQWSLLPALHALVEHSPIISEVIHLATIIHQEGWLSPYAGCWCIYCLLPPKFCLLCGNEWVLRVLSSATCHCVALYLGGGAREKAQEEKVSTSIPGVSFSGSWSTPAM